MTMPRHDAEGRMVGRSIGENKPLNKPEWSELIQKLLGLNEDPHLSLDERVKLVADVSSLSLANPTNFIYASGGASPQTILMPTTQKMYEISYILAYGIVAGDLVTDIYTYYAGLQGILRHLVTGVNELTWSAPAGRPHRVAAGALVGAHATVVSALTIFVFYTATPF
jgi:hypothetical protein